MSLTWHVHVDWDGDGVYEADEADRAIGFSCERGRKIAIKFQDREASGLANVEVGQATLTLSDDDGRYDPYNTGSDLSPNVKPGAYIQVQVTNSLTSVTQDVITGRIANLVPNSSREQVSLTIKDGLQDLTLDKVALAAAVSQYTGNIIADILTAAAWPSLWGSHFYLAEALGETMPYWFSGKTYLDALRDISELKRLFFHCDRHGAALFVGQIIPPGYGDNYKTSQATWTQDRLLKEISLPNPWDNYRNKITVKSYAYTKDGSLTDIWTYGEAPLVEAGHSITIWAEYGPADDIVSPVATTDYLMNSQQGGGGTNRTGSFTVTASKYATRSKLVVTAGAYNGYITLLKIRGKTISNKVAGYTSDPDTGQYNLTIDNPLVQDHDTALTLISVYENFFDGSNGFPVVQMESQPAYQFARDLYEIITLDVEAKNINQDYRIGYIKHQWGGPSGQKVVTTFGLEPPQTWPHG